MLTVYFWNMALSEALQPTLQAFEVALRNGIHHALTIRFGTPRWFDQPGLLLARERNSLRDARGRINKQQTAPRIVSALSFSFWTGVLNRPYHATLWPAAQPRRLLEAFPHLPVRYQSPTPVFRRCNELRQLRNRVAHAEPVFDRSALAQEHQDLIEAIGWISPPLRDIVVLGDRFLPIYHGGQAQNRAALHAYFAANPYLAQRNKPW